MQDSPPLSMPAMLNYMTVYEELYYSNNIRELSGWGLDLGMGKGNPRACGKVSKMIIIITK